MTSAEQERVAKELAREWIKKHRGDDKSICVCGAANCGEFVEADLAGTVVAALAACAREALREVNADAEADMLKGNPITGAHHRAIERKLAALERAAGERASLDPPGGQHES